LYPAPVTVVFLLLACVALPALAIHSNYRLSRGMPWPPKPRLYTQMLLVQLVMLWFGVAVIAAEGLDVFVLPWRLDSWAYALAILIGTTIGAHRGWKQNRATPEQRKRLMGVMPENGTQLAIWICISFAAGTVEEIVYRGVMMQLLTLWTGSISLALFCSVAAFTLAHIGYGWRVAPGIAFIALVFHGLTWYSESIYPGMLVHVLYDIFVGIYFPKISRQLDALAAVQEQAQSAAQA
jgi:membrane protease YdiL (CAAX protease family)